MISINLTREYGHVLFVTLTLCFYTTMIGFIYGGGARKNNFNYENLRHYEKDHKDAYGPDSKVNEQGYPDNGSGRYS